MKCTPGRATTRACAIRMPSSPPCSSISTPPPPSAAAVAAMSSCPLLPLRSAARPPPPPPPLAPASCIRLPLLLPPLLKGRVGTPKMPAAVSSVRIMGDTTTSCTGAAREGSSVSKACAS